MKDYFGYQGKVCVVTGASSGMGKAACEMLVDLGAIVYAMDINPCPVEGINNFIKIDLSCKESILEAFKEIPDTIDSFFGVAGLSGIKTGFTTTFNVNFTANKLITEEFLMKRMQPGGAILFVTSTAGHGWEKYRNEQDALVHAKSWEDTEKIVQNLASIEAIAQLAYGYSKRCMNYYAAELSIEMAKKGIRVNTFLPGSTDTGMKAEFEKMIGGMDNLVAQAGAANRLADSKEMGEPIVFLNSNMASFISGHELLVDYCDNAMKTLKLKEDFLDISFGIVPE